MFLQSLAEERRHLSIGVVLSGTGLDGTLGLEAIKAEGGITFAQDKSAVYEGMPASRCAAWRPCRARASGETPHRIGRFTHPPRAQPPILERSRARTPSSCLAVLNLPAAGRGTGGAYGQGSLRSRMDLLAADPSARGRIQVHRKQEESRRVIITSW